LSLVELLKPIAGRMPVYGQLMYMLYRDPAVSKRRKLHLSAGLLYALSPIDLIPGIIPVVGQLDDIAIALSALLGALKKIPPDRREEYLKKTGLTIDTIEQDLDTAKTVMLYLATRPLEYAGKGVRWAARMVGRVFSRQGRQE